MRNRRSITRICHTAAGESKQPKVASSGANNSNLLNIQIATSEQKPQWQGQQQELNSTQLNTSQLPTSTRASKHKISKGEESRNSA